MRPLTATFAFCLAALGLVLVFPSLFPDIQLPPTFVDGSTAGLLSGMAMCMASAGLIAWDMTAAQPEPPARPVSAAPVPQTPHRLEPARASDAPSAAPVASTPPPVAGRAQLLDLLHQAKLARAEGRLDDALELAEAAVTEARSSYRSQMHGQAATDLAEALAAVAELEEDEGRLEVALPTYDESLALHRAVAQAAPEDPGAALGLIKALERLADCREARGHRSRARDCYAEAMGLAERLTWLEPDSEVYRKAHQATKARFESLNAELKPEPVNLAWELEAAEDEA